MILDGIEAFRESGFTPQVVIVGAGPAGITVARQLAAAHIPCALLDAGGEEFSGESQDVYQGTVIGDPYFELDVARLRYLGGTSGHWAGWCRFLDAVDFEKRDWIPNSGWPIGREVIEPYFDQAREILDLRPFLANEKMSETIDWIDLIRSDPVRFGDKYREELMKSDTICVVLNTYVTDLVATGGRVVAANIVSQRRPAGQISSPRFVIATGGIENSRLLLWSNERSPEPVVPDATSLGRYWMEHPEFEVGKAVIGHPDAYRHESDGWAYFAPAPEAMRQARIMNFHAVIMPAYRSAQKEILADLLCTAPAFSTWALGAMGQNIDCYGNTIGMAWEQSPEFDNRVALSRSETDYTGVPRVELHWRKGELERKTLREGALLFGTMLARSNIGRMKVDSWVLDNEAYPTDHELAGFHHMGGTRMSSDPRLGVVDANCRVHGMSNLFVAGSSIFTTSGYANPTATIVAFSARLGAHLADRVG